MIQLLDIGGEGRFPQAVNLNPSRVQTLGACKGNPIPNHLYGRAEAIPLPARSVRTVIVERTPLRRTAISEIQRVVTPGSIIILRHHETARNPHHTAIEQWGSPLATRPTQIGLRAVRQSVFRLG